MNRLSSGNNLADAFPSFLRSQSRATYRLAAQNVVLFGPPGSGKSAAGRALADRLQRPFADTDDWVQKRTGMSIAELIGEGGEAAFRQIEAQICRELSAQTGWVIACGGGALLDEQTRRQFEDSGLVVCLRCEPQVLLGRLRGDGSRPLLHGDVPAKLEELLHARNALYDSFQLQIDTTYLSLDQVVEHLRELAMARDRKVLQVRQGAGYEVHLGPGLLSEIKDLLARARLGPPHIIVVDSNVAPLYGKTVSAGLGRDVIEVPSGEKAKTLEMVQFLYEEFITHGLERQGTILAVGGGVLTDIAGFAAATFMRGVRWVAVPTTLLGMVDASVGGKVGVDLAQGKNLVGAFHPPALVVADTNTLATLPEAELRAGMAEVLKAAMIGDAELFQRIEQSEGIPGLGWISRALAVKVSIVEADPFDTDQRAVLNFGHTVGHGLELASGFSLTHGEAVAIGMVAETILAERLELAENGLAQRLSAVLKKLGLPATYSRCTPEAVRRSMQTDKKRSGRMLRFSLPVEPGNVRYGMKVPDSIIMDGLIETWDRQ